MPWITPSDIDGIYGVTVTADFIAHVQHLAESCVGEQDDPSDRLQAAFIDVVYRKHLATTGNPRGLNQETLGEYSYSMSGAPGLGLTKNDCKSLKKAVGVSSLWVQPVSRGAVETASSPSELLMADDLE